MWHNSREYSELRELLNDIELLLALQGIAELVELSSYAEILRLLRNKRRER